MKTMRAVIDWMTSEQGGRRQPPTGDGSMPYSATVRFTGEPWPAPEAWSLVVRKARMEGPYRWVANVSFLVPEAPHHLLSQGNRFELYEGNRCVAHGTIEEPVLSVG
jgi:hypothetical protein